VIYVGLPIRLATCCPPGKARIYALARTKHWHGASPTTGMNHVAIAESLDGKSTNWMEKVSDEQYKK
jgi:hypothetical protein